MDIDYHVIAERDHDIMNPTSPAKLDRLIDYCRIADGTSVLDIGCGKAWLLRRMAERAAIKGLGIDSRDAFLDVARAEMGTRPHRGAIEFRTIPALDFNDAVKFDVSLCIGAPFAIGASGEAVDWLIARTRPGGVLALGDLFALKRPWPPILREQFGDSDRTMFEFVQMLESRGLTLTGVIETSTDDWNHYESQHYRAIAEWARENPNHPERQAVLDRDARAKHQYLEFERDYLGWAIFVCRVP